MLAIKDKARCARLAVLTLAMTLLLSFTAFAAESVTMNIPVVARGADCTAAILDASGQTLQTLALRDGVENRFTIECEGLERTVYTIRLTDADTDAVTYDKTVYEAAVTLYYRPSGELGSLLEIRLAGDVAAPKKEIAEFVNETQSISPVSIDPPVKKRVEGSPETDETFTFVMTAVGNTAGLSRMPMPNGAQAQSVTMQITGAGEKEFGAISFDASGVYVYSVTEQRTDAEGYTFDATVYTVTATVTREGNRLNVTTAIVRGDGTAADEIVFTNVYAAPSQTETPDPTTTATAAPTATATPGTAGPGTGGGTTATGVSPRTGDERNLTFWIGASAVVLCAIIALAIWYVWSKRRSKR